MMRRPAHGGTARPSHARPGNGFGRRAVRPGPLFAIEPADAPEPEWFEDESLVPVHPVLAPAERWREVLDS